MTDFLTEMIERRTVRNPEFSALVEAALHRRELAHALAAERRAVGMTQTELAAALGTSQSQVARIESGNGDTKVSTLARFAAVLGLEIEFHLKPSAPPEKRARRRVAAHPR